jgi:hypothetical protein
LINRAVDESTVVIMSAGIIRSPPTQLVGHLLLLELAR